MSKLNSIMLEIIMNFFYVESTLMYVNAENRQFGH